MGLKPGEKIWFDMGRCMHEEMGIGFGESERG